MREEDKESKDRLIDLSTKRSELGWSYAAQEFFEKATVAWFKWVGWMFAIGGISYLAERTDSFLLELFESISLGLLSIYFMMFFISIRVEPYHSWCQTRKSKIGRLIAFGPIAIGAALMFLGSQEIIDMVIKLVKSSK